MTLEEVLEFIYSKQIPLEFVWDDGDIYYLVCYTGNNSTSCHPDCTDFWSYPKWDNYRSNSHMYYIQYEHYLIFNSKKPTIEENISDFLYWFESNKHKCKKINYYTLG